MAGLKKICVILFCLGVITISGGCSMLSTGTYYDNVEEAREVMLRQLEKKYQKEFTFTGEESYQFDEGNGCYVFRARFEDEEGLEAAAILTQTKSPLKRIKDANHIISIIPTKDDTYSAVYYTKKATEAIEPLFEGEDFEKYIISLSNTRHAGKDLGLTLEEFFEDGGVYYWLEVILPDNQSEEEYTQTIYQFYKKLTAEQKLAFALVVYANGSEIFSNYYVDAEGFYPAKTYEDIEEKMMFYNKDPMPEDKWMTWDYRIKGQYQWVKEENW